MADPRQKSWSDNPYAPKIPHILYFQEKANFAGHLIGSILYGIVVVLFFKCMAALFNSDYRRGEPIKWWLVSYTVIMFSIVTILTGMQLNVQSISCIDNREFPGIDGVVSSGPLGYQALISPDTINIIPDVMFLLNNWLADGLLLYRCYIIYSMNLWVITFPSLMYLGSLAMGSMLIVGDALGPNSSTRLPVRHFDISYFSISLSLNILLTLLMVIRLVLHTRGTRSSGLTGTGGVYIATITMLVESSALYAMSSVLVLGPWSVGNGTLRIFLPILYETQVIAPLLVIHRVASKNALTNTTVFSRRISSVVGVE